MVAEVTARECGLLDIGEALELTALVAAKDRARAGRLSVRWLQRWLDDADTPGLEETAMVVGLLLALGEPRHDEALAGLRAAAREG
jgi:hypothetical protein